MGIPFTTGWSNRINPITNQKEGGTGIIADIGTHNSPCVGLRADMDGLPMREKVILRVYKTHFFFGV